MSAATHLHTAALALLARPALEPRQLDYVDGLRPVASLLWHADALDDDGQATEALAAPDVGLFMHALDQLLPHGLAHGAAPMVQVLTWLGASFRALPGRLLGAMAMHWLEACDGAACGYGPQTATDSQKLAKLAIGHVGHWWANTDQPAKRNPEDFAKMLAAAQTWRVNEEIVLRQTPRDWSNPLECSTGVAGFEMLPMLSTSQLADSMQHKGVLCSLARREACEGGREVWLYAKPRFVTDEQELCLIGLARPDSHSAWGSPMVYGPIGSHDLLERAAAAIATRDAHTKNLERLRQIGGLNQATAAGVHQMFAALLQR